MNYSELNLTNHDHIIDKNNCSNPANASGNSSIITLNMEVILCSNQSRNNKEKKKPEAKLDKLHFFTAFFLISKFSIIPLATVFIFGSFPNILREFNGATIVIATLLVLSFFFGFSAMAKEEEISSTSEKIGYFLGAILLLPLTVLIGFYVIGDIFFENFFKKPKRLTSFIFLLGIFLLLSSYMFVSFIIINILNYLIFLKGTLPKLKGDSSGVEIFITLNFLSALLLILVIEIV